MRTVRLSANHGKGWSRMTLRWRLNTKEQYDEILADLPKYVHPGFGFDSITGDYLVSVAASFKPKQDNAKNEAGAKRMRRALETCEKLGYKITKPAVGSLNSIEFNTFDDARAWLGKKVA